MEYHLKTFICSRQERIIKASGDRLWDVICNEVPGPAFRMSDAAAALSEAFGYSPNTARLYARAIIANVRAESGDEVLERHGNMYRWRMGTPQTSRSV